MKAEQGTQVGPSWMGGGADCTIAYYRCQVCRALKSEQLEGRWTKEMLS
jgi:hypothetical protein